jgi:hypothetical protein
MQESYGEGVASHAGPESCAGVREGVGEALTGGDAGRVLSREIHDPLRGADVLEDGGRPHRRRRSREAQPDPAVRDPEHAPNHLAREPGDPAFVCGRGRPRHTASPWAWRMSAPILPHRAHHQSRPRPRARAPHPGRRLHSPSPPPEAEALCTWALRIAARPGTHVAVVALARRLAGILYALLRDDSGYRPRRAVGIPAAVGAINGRQ